ncbi:hypothetical protein B0H10DRAFT_2054226 [Mycena sp. CBHHK59/15]|nr:hypothetical protein B0H10DRAFT_2054226 [Mycena sp. CBHHK59/15]
MSPTSVRSPSPSLGFAAGSYYFFLPPTTTSLSEYRHDARPPTHMGTPRGSSVTAFAPKRPDTLSPIAFRIATNRDTFHLGSSPSWALHHEGEVRFFQLDRQTTIDPDLTSHLSF